MAEPGVEPEGGEGLLMEKGLVPLSLNLIVYVVGCALLLCSIDRRINKHTIILFISSVMIYHGTLDSKTGIIRTGAVRGRAGLVFPQRKFLLN